MKSWLFKFNTSGTSGVVRTLVGSKTEVIEADREKVAFKRFKKKHGQVKVVSCEEIPSWKVKKLV